MEITAQLDEETIHQLQQIQQQTNQNQAEILKAAIAAYYDQVQDNQSIVEQPQSSQTQKKTPFEAFQELGLVGCIDGEPDSSQNYKAVIDQYLQEKHDQGCL
ncbi:hypothetical protein LEP3755_35730 [Leptolyngbya sp. NIES-3755]|nr:hypothetical protein LEP3755_35730 [Leptolyngbya sp. NIES-3755]